MFFNQAYARLWRLDAAWLSDHPSQGEVLDAMRERRMLPETVDFLAFKEGRQRLFTNLIEPLEELMHLPDGATLRLVVTPHPQGGLLYFYEDVSDRLALERTRNLQIAVQKATLYNLSEGVAVMAGSRCSTPATPKCGGSTRLFSPPGRTLAISPSAGVC